MAQVTLEAEFQERKRIIFTARERATVNVRVESTDGGPLGYTSYELLLIALANCTMGVVMNHDSVKELPVRSCRAVLDANTDNSPARITEINMRLELDVEGASERLQQRLQRVADSCPVGNTLRFSPAINIDLVLRDAAQEPILAESTSN